MRSYPRRLLIVSLGFVIFAIFGMLLVFLLLPTGGSVEELFFLGVPGTLAGIAIGYLVPKKQKLLYLRYMNRTATRAETAKVKHYNYVALVIAFLVRLVIRYVFPEKTGAAIYFLGFMLISFLIYDLFFALKNIEAVNEKPGSRMVTN